MKKRLSKSEIRELNKQIKQLYKIENMFNKKDAIDLYEDKEFKFIIKDKPLFFYVNDKPIPTLHLLLQNQILKHIEIDMPAIKFITNGADVMRPGITFIDEGIEQNELITIADETHKKPLAVGIATLNTEELKKAKTGKVIKNVHYIGDKIWTYPN